MSIRKQDSRLGADVDIPVLSSLYRVSLEENTRLWKSAFSELQARAAEAEAVAMVPAKVNNK